MKLVRAALGKPHLPFLAVVTKMDMVKGKNIDSTKTEITQYISGTLKDDRLDVYFVCNYTREELTQNSTVIEVAKDASKKQAHKVAEAQSKYDAMIKSCRLRNSGLLAVVLGALSAVITGDSN